MAPWIMWDYLSNRRHQAREVRHAGAARDQPLLRYFCANTSLTYFLRTMSAVATAKAAAVHDALITRAFHRIVGTQLASKGELVRSVAQ